MLVPSKYIVANFKFPGLSLILPVCLPLKSSFTIYDYDYGIFAVSWSEEFDLEAMALCL